MSDQEISPRVRFGLALVVLARQWRRVIDHRLSVLGLSDASWTPLVHLAGAGDGVPQTELAKRIGLDGSSLVRLLDALSERSLIERRIDPRDRRLRRIHLTEAGRKATAEIREKLSSAEVELLSVFSDAELSELLEAFDRLGDRIATVENGEGSADGE